MDITILPYDILQAIVGTFRGDSRTLFRCTLVSKQLNEPATFELYKDIKIESWIDADGAPWGTPGAGHGYLNAVGIRALNTLAKPEKLWLRSAVGSIEHHFSVVTSGMPHSRRRLSTTGQLSLIKPPQHFSFWYYLVPMFPNLRAYTLRAMDYTIVPQPFLSSLVQILNERHDGPTVFNLYTGPLFDFHMPLLDQLPRHTRELRFSGTVIESAIPQFGSVLQGRQLTRLEIQDAAFITPASIVHIMPVLPTLIHLRLGSRHTLSPAELLTTVLIHSPNLQTLDIFYSAFLTPSNAALGPESAKVSLPSLYSLTIRHEAVAGRTRYKELMSWLTLVLKDTEVLEEFRLLADDLRECKIQWSMDIVQTLLGSRPARKKLVSDREELLSGTAAVDEDPRSKKSMERGHSLKVVDIPFVSIGREALRELAIGAPNLEVLGFGMEEPPFSVCPTSWNIPPNCGNNIHEIRVRSSQTQAQLWGLNMNQAVLDAGTNGLEEFGEQDEFLNLHQLTAGRDVLIRTLEVNPMFYLYN
ncbi:hypothetical protein BDN72DRAFT_857399 [Pluteus cervinus]|uniref:Uncharacterized protein n=1 Tax=Pluteus cervinus TaxID=181527 RepID=A0ACD3AX06_9AGAR|nr:hypothetical protein BDN72DRAFT_857399 [Pluteus cervinus]